MRCMSHATTRAAHLGIRVGTCWVCSETRFRDTAGGSDPWVAMSTLFGEYELVGRVDTIHAPVGEVLAYRSHRPADAAALRVTPPHRWFKVNEHLWMCHDGALLLLAHRSPHVSRVVGA